jgi:hypothetical protein
MTEGTQIRRPRAEPRVKHEDRLRGDPGRGGNPTSRTPLIQTSWSRSALGALLGLIPTKAGFEIWDHVLLCR